MDRVSYVHKKGVIVDDTSYAIKCVEIIIEGKHTDEQEIREILSNFTSSTFSFHTTKYEDWVWEHKGHHQV